MKRLIFCVAVAGLMLLRGAPAFVLSNTIDTGRYLWETGARVKTQGETLAVTATFPVPSVRLK